MKYKTSIIGHFSNSLDGQTIKTKVITDELVAKFGTKKICRFNTAGGIIAFVRFLFIAPFLVKNSANLIMFPAHNALRVVTPILMFWNRLFKRRLHYCVIGGWLPEFLKKRKRLSNELKKIDYIYVETQTMKSLLEKDDFENVVVVPNCKKLKALNPEELEYQSSEPYSLCTFSRVNKNKGIEEAISAVKKINEEKRRIVYKLDIYGQVDIIDEEWFKNLENEFPSYIEYKGSIPFDESVEILKDYFLLLFPTKYYTEGIPGTIIDAYAAGLPVIASKWLNFNDVIEDEKTGFGFEFNNFKMMMMLLERFANQPNEIFKLRSNCLEKYNFFSPNYVVKQITDNLL